MMTTAAMTIPQAIIFAVGLVFIGLAIPTILGVAIYDAITLVRDRRKDQL